MPISILPDFSSTSAEWGHIKGTIANQTDLASALDGKSNQVHRHDADYEPKNEHIAEHLSDTGNPHGTTANQVLPAQSGNQGKSLVTDGSSAKWSDILPVQAACSEQLSANKTLTLESPRFQFLEPLTTHRNIYLPSAESANGRIFTIQNTANPTSTINLLVFVGTTQIGIVSPRNTLDFVSNGNAWKQYSTDATVTGSNSVAHSYSVSIGANITSNSTYSVSIGYCSTGNNSYGCAVGAYSTTNNFYMGAALGAFTNCYRAGEICKSLDSSSNHRWSVLHWTANTNNDTWTEALIGSSRCPLLISYVFSFRMMIHGRDATRNIARSWEIIGSARRNSTSTELVGGAYIRQEIASDTGTENWDVRVSTDNTYCALRIEVKGDNSSSIGWCASSINFESKK